MSVPGRKPAVAQYLNGPRSLTVHYNQSEDKTIYVFGEFLWFQDACPNTYAVNINTYLKRLFRSTQVPIDYLIKHFMY